MARLVRVVTLGIIGLVIVTAVTPTLIALLHAVVEPVIVATIAAVVARLVWFYTQRW